MSLSGALPKICAMGDIARRVKVFFGGVSFAESFEFCPEISLRFFVYF
jgi:hypothetical protein